MLDAEDYEMSSWRTCWKIFSAARTARMALFRRRWSLRGGDARKKAAGTSKKCAWSRSERQPFCGGLALNDWRAEAAQRGRLGALCPCVPTMCPHACRYRYLWCAARLLSRWLREHALSLLSFARSFYMLPANVPHRFYALRHGVLVWRASFCGP